MAAAKAGFFADLIAVPGNPLDRHPTWKHVDCPSCGKAAVSRQLTAPSFRLAGSGWYETDFKKEGDKKKNLADAPAAPPKAE